MSAAAPSRRRAVISLAGVQFVAALDHMLILPLGPDLARGVGLPLPWLGALVAAYTVAAAAAGLLAVRFLDRVPRGRALALGCAGLALAALAASAATTPTALIAARICAGLMGAPLIALTQAGVADLAAPGRRGRAMAAVLTANAVASVAGVPIALAVGDAVGWQAALQGVAGLAIAAAATIWWLPEVTRAADAAPIAVGFGRPDVRRCAVLIAAAAGATFALAPHLSTWLQFNLGLPRGELSFVYGVGGAGAIVGMLLAGRAVDRWGTLTMVRGASLGLAGAVALYIVPATPWLPLLVGFVALMSLLAVRNVAVRTLVNLVPAIHERAGFLSLMTAVQFAASAAAALGSAAILTTDGRGALENFGALGAVAIGLSLLLLPVAARQARRGRA